MTLQRKLARTPAAIVAARAGHSRAVIGALLVTALFGAPRVLSAQEASIASSRVRRINSS